MATTTALAIDAVQLGTTETVVVPTIPANTEYNIPVIRFTNVDTVDRTVTIFNYDATGESASNTTTEYEQLTIQAQSTFEYGPLVLPANRRITAQADVAAVISARVHGWQTI